VITPLPPAASGVADYSYRLIEALREHCDVHAYADGLRFVEAELGPPRAPEGVEVLPVRRLLEQERARGGYDCVVYCLGNSQYHAGALAQLRHRSGIVLAHEVRLTDLYALSADEPGAVPEGFAACLNAMYDGLPDGAGESGRLAPDEAERLGVLMAAEIVELANRFVVMSEFAADRVQLDVRPEDAERISVVPFGMPEPVEGATPAADREPLIASFGVVNEIKQYSLLVAALPAIIDQHPNAQLAFVGPCADADRDELVAQATALDVVERVTVTGAVTAAEYASWLDRAAVAVQLRRTANGESSAAVADCLASGAAVVVTGIGAGRDLPDTGVERVGSDVSALELATRVSDLLADPARRAKLASAAREYAAEHSFAVVAQRLFEDVIEPATRAGLSVARMG
jgi:glycosyltransferase involved in cell wall biosynthesis